MEIGQLGDGGNGRFQLETLRRAQQDAQRLQESWKNPADTDHQKLKKAAKDFEGVFVRQLLDAMDRTVSREDSVLSGGHAEDVFRGLFNEHVANAIANRPGGSGFGLAETIYQQMSRQLDAEKNPPPGAGVSGSRIEVEG